MILLWTLYLTATDLGRGARRRLADLSGDRERGDMNISKAIYAALAVTLGGILVGAITLAVNNRIGTISGGGSPEAP